MAKVKNEFCCRYCGRQIEYGSPGAILYDDNLYCDTDCLLGDLNIKADPWEDEYEYDYTEDETNGFGIKYIREDSYSNGRYVIFDKCPFEFEDDYNDYFGVLYRDEAPNNVDLIALLMEHKDEMQPLSEFPRTVKRKGNIVSENPLFFSEILGLWVITDYWTFVIMQLSGSQFVKPSEISVARADGMLLIECHGKQAIIASNLEPKEHPERFEEAEYYGEGLCGEGE